jgi:TonB family protein
VARKILFHIAALGVAAALSGAAVLVVSAQEGAQGSPPPAAAAGQDLNIEAILNTNDSLSFSASKIDDETVVEPDKGEGFVRSILDTPFGETKAADFLFRRNGILYLLIASGIAAIGLMYHYGARGPTELPVPSLTVATGHTLPVVGEAHPVERMSMSLSQRAAAIAILGHVMIFGAWLVGRNLPKTAPPRRMLRFVTISELAAPPSLSGNDAPPPVNVQQEITQPTIGLPEPVPDWQAPDVQLATQQEMANFQTPGLEGVGEGGDVVVVQNSGDVLNLGRGGGIVDVDMGEVPVLLNMPKPVYPEIARTAEVEGVVTLQILVGEDGHVKEVKVAKGHPMLNEAAIAAARGATFKPATQQKHPVPVWVEFPMRFTLY